MKAVPKDFKAHLWSYDFSAMDLFAVVKVFLEKKVLEIQ